MVTVYELFDLSILPEEYLPDDYKGPSAGKLTDIIGTCNIATRKVFSLG